MSEAEPCPYCDPDEDLLITRCEEAIVLVPSRSHISPRDGGHLVVTLPRHVPSRLELIPGDLLALDFGTVVAAFALRHVFDATLQNFQENGNWAADDPSRMHVHIHVYGRARDAIDQPYGEAITL